MLLSSATQQMCVVLFLHLLPASPFSIQPNRVLNTDGDPEGPYLRQ